MRIETEAEEQRRIRIRLLCAAYFYYHEPEFYFMSDNQFDMLAKEVILDISTGHEALDVWFKECYSPSTGMWVNQLPAEEFHKLYWLCQKIKRMHHEIQI